MFPGYLAYFNRILSGIVIIPRSPTDGVLIISPLLCNTQLIAAVLLVTRISWVLGISDSMLVWTNSGGLSDINVFVTTTCNLFLLYFSNFLYMIISGTVIPEDS